MHRAEAVEEGTPNTACTKLLWGLRDPLLKKQPQGEKPAQHLSGQGHGSKSLNHPCNLDPTALNTKTHQVLQATHSNSLALAPSTVPFFNKHFHVITSHASHLPPPAETSVKSLIHLQNAKPSYFETAWDSEG